MLNPHITVLWDEIICHSCGRIKDSLEHVYRIPLKPQNKEFICSNCGEEEKLKASPNV
jgi:transposase